MNFPQICARHLEYGGAFYICAEREDVGKTGIDKQTAAILDAEIAAMPEEQRHELARIGNRIIRGLDTPEGQERKNAYQMDYMRKYRARIALAKQRGLLHKG